MSGKINRRSFVERTALAGTGVVISPLLAGAAGFFNSVDDTIRIALVGCGGRGTGAATQALSTKQNVKLVAMAEAFQDNLESSLANIINEVGKDKVDVPKDRQYVGFDAYKQAISHADVVILATPPGFRPIHFAEAIAQNKHVFMEKPVATDAPGVQKVLETAKMAKQKKLNVVVGLQRHYQTKYTKIMDLVHDGKIGDITSAQAYWNGAGVWVRPRKPGQTEMEYQMRNWYYFNWLCGDHITEQHIHNLDVINWAKQSYPVSAQGMGGRQVRTGKEYGEIYDHHYVEFTYADGSIMNSQCRHIKDCWNEVNEKLTGTKGTVDFGAGSVSGYNGKSIYQHNDKNDPNPYQVEHDMLFAAIANGEYKYDNAEYGAKSTMTSILGRMATYSGKMIKWDEAINSKMSIMPSKYDWNANPPVMPDEDGYYPIPMPGSTEVI
ncbi:MAG: Gfo/Idh/MocA family oxidoreductase [Saprospiraceae bacterium]|nr:Gfo/Idh/MocA family oxidoreductase [Saprospiraceae bacterium]